MVKLSKVKNIKRNWILEFKDIPYKLELNLLQYSLTNRFECVQELFEDIDNLMDEFSEFLYDLLTEYINSSYNSYIILNNKEKIKDIAERYIELKNINFSKFVDRSKVTKTSILYDETDLKNIAITSTCLKIYSIFQYDETLKIPENINKQIYNYFVNECKEYGTADKIFQTIRSRSFRSSVTDRYMWELIKMTVLETPETNSMSVFNFFMTNLLSLLNVEQNPVYYIIKIADDSIRWMMCEIYREKIIYDETFGGPEDIGHVASREAFYLYCCNDTVSKCVKISMSLLESEFNIDQDKFIDIKDRLDNIKYLDPCMRLFTIPIISKVLEVPYKFLLTVPPKHILLLGTLIYILSKDILDKQYPVLINFLLCYPDNHANYIVRSSYKLRDTDIVMEDDTPLFGINSRKLKFDMISPICGILSASKKNLVSIIDGNNINKITYTDLEADCIDFYKKLYSNNLTNEFNKIQNRLNKYI